MGTKKIGFIISVLLSFLILTSQFSANASTIPLEEAVKDGKVEVNIIGMGGSTGDTILLRVQRRVPKILRLGLTPGTVFKSRSGSVQDMIGAKIKGERVGPVSYRPSSEIYLHDDNEREYIVEAYCLDFHKPNPGSNDTFVISPPDELAKNIITKGQKAGYSTKVIQSAIWIDRAKVSASKLKKRFPVNDEDINAARTLLKEIQKPVKGKLFVKTDPNGAKVRILNIRPGFFQGIELKPGRYHIEVSAKGYKVHKEWIKLDSAEVKKMILSLEPQIPKTTSGKRDQGIKAWILQDDAFLLNDDDEVIARLKYKTPITVLEDSPANGKTKITITGWINPSFASHAKIISENQVKIGFAGGRILAEPRWTGRSKDVFGEAQRGIVYKYQRKLKDGDDLYFKVSFEGFVDSASITKDYNETIAEDQRKEAEYRKARKKSFAPFSGVFAGKNKRQMKFSKIAYYEGTPEYGPYYPTKLLGLTRFIVIRPDKSPSIRVMFKNIKKISCGPCRYGAGQGYAIVKLRNGKELRGYFTGDGWGDVKILLMVGESEVKVNLSYSMQNCTIELDNPK